MNELDPKVKMLLEKINALLLEKAASVSLGRPVPFLDVEINTLVNAVRMIEGNTNG